MVRTPSPIGEATRVVGRNIHAVRQSRGWSRQTLADRLGISQSMIGRWEAGMSNISVEQLYACADALGVKPSRLLRMSGETTR